MKILVLNYEFPPLGGGASPVSYEITKGYVKMGHEVDVITMAYKNLPKFEIIDGIKINRVPCLRRKKDICHPWEQLSYLISAKIFLKKHVKKTKYDICHCHFIIPTGPLALWLKKIYGIPYIITAHGSDVLGYNKRFKYLYPLLIKPWKRIIKEAKVITTPSMFLQKEIAKISTDGIFKIIPNCIDTAKFKPLSKEKYILCVSRLFINKGIQDLLKALYKINLNGWKVKIVGTGPYEKKLFRLRKNYGLEKHVEFLGWVDNKSDKIKELYGHASIFVQPSHFENMSMVLLEALASGCHVLATNVGGNPEIIEKENLFEKENHKQLRNIIVNLIQNNEFKPNLNIDSLNLTKINKQYEELFT